MLWILMTMCLMPDFDTLAWLKGWCDVSFPPSTEGIVSSVFFFCLLLIKTLYATQRSVIHVVVIDHFAKDSWRDKDYQNRQLKTKSIVAKFTFLTGLFVFKSLCQYLCYQSCPTDLFCDITWKYWITKVLIILFLKNSSLGLASSPWCCLPVHRSAEINGWRKMLLICTSKICFYQRYYVEAS